MPLFSDLVIGLFAINSLFFEKKTKIIHYDTALLHERVKDYKNKSKVLRQIHSNKMESCRFKKDFYNRTIFSATVLLTFFSFYGLQKFHEAFVTKWATFATVEFIYNITVLIVLIFSALQMASRLGEQEIEHLGSVKRLTDFITDLDDILLVPVIDKEICCDLIAKLNDRYEGITSSLPRNSDAEWRKAKKQIGEKKNA